MLKRLTATEAARNFSDVLDSVEHDSETVVIERRGRPVATLSPASGAPGRAVRELLGAHRVDRAWPEELAELRGKLAPEGPRWDA